MKVELMKYLGGRNLDFTLTVQEREDAASMIRANCFAFMDALVVVAVMFAAQRG